MREYIFPLTLALFAMVGGTYIALAPLLDPGFVHPIALASSGIMFAMFGTGFMVATVAMAIGDRARSRA